MTIRSTMTDVTKRSFNMGKTSSAPDRSMPKSNTIKGPLKDQVRSGGADKSMGGK